MSIETYIINIQKLFVLQTSEKKRYLFRNNKRDIRRCARSGRVSNISATKTRGELRNVFALLKKTCYVLTSSRGRFMNWGNTSFVFEERTRFVGKETCSNNHLLCEVLLINNVWCLFLDPGSFFTFSCVLDKTGKPNLPWIAI